MALFAEAGLLMGIQYIFGHYVQPRGAGWIFIPIMLGTLGATFSVSLVDSLKVHLFSLSKEWRLAVVLVLAWIMTTALYITLAKPYGRVITADEYTSVLGWIFAPPAVSLAIWRGIKWAMAGR